MLQTPHDPLRPPDALLPGSESLPSSSHPQGLFRLAAGASVLRKLKSSLASGSNALEEFYSDPHAVAGECQQGTGCGDMNWAVPAIPQLPSAPLLPLPSQVH